MSHVFDWAAKLELFGAAYAPSALASVLARLQPWRVVGSIGNPYVLGGDAAIFAHLLLDRDFDVFVRLLNRLNQCKPPIKKGDAAHCYAEAVEELAEDAESRSRISPGRQRMVYALFKDLARAVRRSDTELGASSTAWHRTASRMESYVDIGLLEKGPDDSEALYEYVYYPTKAFERAIAGLRESRDADDWLDRFLIPTLCEGVVGDQISRDTLVECVVPVVNAIGRPTAPLPIDAVVLGVVWLQIDRDCPVTIGAVRTAIEALARSEPSLARLARGH
ncbi:MAG: hypothetical protein VX528_10585, partial [Candidatus Latescibacterota bacterium]|nr:hypothetical protein [Candidatus Latescibacterota bacterium]